MFFTKSSLILDTSCKAVSEVRPYGEIQIGILVLVLLLLFRLIQFFGTVSSQSFHKAHGYLSSHRPSTPFGQHRTILLGDRYIIDTQ